MPITKDRLDKTETDLVELNAVWVSMPNIFQAQKNKMIFSISKLRSLIEKSNENKEVMKSSQLIINQAKTLKEYTTEFRKKIDEAQLLYNEEIDGIKLNFINELNENQREFYCDLFSEGIEAHLHR